MLLVVNGIGSLIGSIFVFKKYAYSKIIGLGLGGFLMSWIISQIFFIGFDPFFHITFFMVGFIEFTLGLKLHLNSKNQVTK